ncbi:MAG: exodeoxyribonuclease III [Candidatus Margulisbacteria bacterium]|nr:exodeoxyribonuclease III [Candidatus Margulisiibacteriota bacterium]
MKLVSWNVNGVRACYRKGALQSYLQTHEPDILCLQESKACVDDLIDEILNPSGYYGIWHSAQKKGYSGVAILTKKKPKMVLEGFGISEYDYEGRVAIAEYDDFILLSVYFPNGQRDAGRLEYKLNFYRDFFNYCEDLRKEGKELIICGDYNIAHKPIDLARPKENEKMSGFLPVEREWMDRIVELGYIDTFRQFNQEPNQYSWWNVQTRARDRNIGWRIDYFFITPGLLPKLKDAFIQQDVLGSDHCPVGIVLG